MLQSYNPMQFISLLSNLMVLMFRPLG